MNPSSRVFVRVRRKHEPTPCPWLPPPAYPQIQPFAAVDLEQALCVAAAFADVEIGG